MSTHRHSTGLYAIALALAVMNFAARADVDKNLPSYTPVGGGLSGSISSVGSDTLAYVMSYWTVEFKRHYPGVKVMLDVSGSGSAPPALIDGTASIAPMSRPMKDSEVAAFVKKFGYQPTEIRVGIDALAVYVNKENPLKGLSLAQVDAIFSSTRKCGHAGDIVHWDQAGLSGDWDGREIALFGRNNLSGTHSYFKDKALCGGNYKNSVKVRQNPVDVLQSVAGAKGGIGYAGIGHQVAGARVLPVAKNPGEPFVEPVETNIVNGQYPLTRFLYIYVNKQPDKPLSPLEREFLKMALSAGGQRYVATDGFIPLSADAAAREREKL